MEKVNFGCTKDIATIKGHFHEINKKIFSFTWNWI